MQFYNRITDQTISPQLWQEQLKPGDYYVIEHHSIDEVRVYGQILDTRKNCASGFFNVRAYSTKYPGGEVGFMCILEVTCTISCDEFEAARRNRWV
jgi:hypothetical protein